MKKQFSFLLALIVALLSVSCGSSETPSDTGSSAASAAEAQSTALIDTLAEADFGGKDFTIWGEKQTTRSDYFEAEDANGDVIIDAVFERNRVVEERYNLKLKFTLADWGSKNVQTLQTLILSGDNSVDLYTATHLYQGPMLVSNYYVDWNTVPTVDLSLPCYVADANRTYSIGGKTPLLFGEFMESNVLRCWNFVFNRRLVDENKLEDPYKAVDEGRWTIDYLMNATKNISRDLDGDTKFTETDFYGFATDKLATLDAFSRSVGIRAIKKDADNLPVLDFYNDNVVEAFEKIYALYYDCPGTYVIKDSLAHIDGIFAEGNAVFASSRIDLLMNEKMRDFKDDYGVLPYPKLKESQDYATYLSGTFSAQMIAVCQPEANREKIGIVAQALNVLGHANVVPAIYETTLKTKTTRDEDSVRMLDLILANRIYSFDSCDEANFALSPIKTLRGLIGSSRSKDIASYYASSKEQAEAWIQSMIDAYRDAE